MGLGQELDEEGGGRDLWGGRVRRAEARGDKAGPSKGDERRFHSEG